MGAHDAAVTPTVCVISFDLEVMAILAEKVERVEGKNAISGCSEGAGCWLGEGRGIFCLWSENEKACHARNVFPIRGGEGLKLNEQEGGGRWRQGALECRGHYWQTHLIRTFSSEEVTEHRRLWRQRGAGSENGGRV